MGLGFRGSQGCMYCNGECNTSCMWEQENIIAKKLFKAMENENFLFNACISYRSDFVSLPNEQKDIVIGECKKWIEALANAANLL